jgi:hypothetical protein
MSINCVSLVLNLSLLSNGFSCFCYYSLVREENAYLFQFSSFGVNPIPIASTDAISRYKKDLSELCDSNDDTCTFMFCFNLFFLNLHLGQHDKCSSILILL